MSNTDIETEVKSGELVAPATGALARVQAGELIVAAPGQARATVRELTEALPDAETDPTEAMMAFVLNSPTFTSWEQLWQSQGLKALAGQRLRVHDIRGSLSQYKESKIGYFLVVDAELLPGGERTVITTGSEMTMAQLIVAKWRNWLPMDFEVVAGKLNPVNGNQPYHLRALGRVAVAETEA